MLAIRRCAGRGTGSPGEALHQDPAKFRGESQFANLAAPVTITPARWSGIVSGPGPCEPLLEDRRAATDADPAERLTARKLRASSRCLAEIAPEQARVVVLKDALGFSFPKRFSVAADMPRTAKCLRASWPQPPCETSFRTSRDYRAAVRPEVIGGDPPASRAVFSLIDEVIELRPGEGAVARKTVTRGTSGISADTSRAGR